MLLWLFGAITARGDAEMAMKKRLKCLNRLTKWSLDEYASHIFVWKLRQTIEMPHFRSVFRIVVLDWFRLGRSGSSGHITKLTWVYIVLYQVPREPGKMKKLASAGAAH